MILRFDPLIWAHKLKQMRVYIIISAILGFSMWGNAQTQTMLFEKSWGEPIDVGLWYADELPNGDYILMGGKRFFNQGATQNYACRIDAKGNIIWEQDWGNPNEMDGISKVLALADGTYMIAGGGCSGISGGIGDATLTNLGPDGTILFHNYYNFGYDDAATDIFETNDGSFVISGVGGGLGNYYPIYMKVGRNGNELWRRSQTALADYGQFYISECPDHSFISVGITDGNRNTYMARHDSVGVLLWVEYPFGQGDSVGNRAQSLRTNADGTFTVNYSVFYPAGSGHESILSESITYDSDGSKITQASYEVQLLSVRLSSNDSSFYGIENGTALYRIDKENNLHKEVELDPSVRGKKDLMYFTPTRDSGYIAVGQQHPDDNTPRNFYVVKFSADGRYQISSFLETVTIFPNPSTDGNITLRFETPTNEDVHVNVYTTDGLLIYTDQIYCPANSLTELPIKLDLGSASCGIYILETKTSGEFRRQKLVVAMGR